MFSSYPVKDTKDSNTESTSASSPVLKAPNNSPFIEDKQNVSYIPKLTLSIPDENCNFKPFSTILAPKSGKNSFTW